MPQSVIYSYRVDPDDEKNKQDGDGEYVHLNPRYCVCDRKRVPYRMTQTAAKQVIRNFWRPGSELLVFHRESGRWCSGHVSEVLQICGMRKYHQLKVHYVIGFPDDDPNYPQAHSMLVKRCDENLIKPWHSTLLKLL